MVSFPQYDHGARGPGVRMEQTTTQLGTFFYEE